MSRQTRLGLTLATGVLALVAIVVSVVEATRYDHRQATAAGVPAPLAVGTELQRPRSVPAVGLIDQPRPPLSAAGAESGWSSRRR